MEEVPVVKPTKRFSKKLDFFPKWLKFTSFNQFVDRVNIIPFKCPMSSKYDEYLEAHEIFHFKDVYDFSVSQSKPITDIIDLTYTDKYYTSVTEELDKIGVTHHKFQIAGKRIPRPRDLKRMLDKMDELIKSERVLGVHCTHGINRTGFMICSYLTKKLEWKPEDALKAFEMARGFPLEHGDYIEEILNPKVWNGQVEINENKSEGTVPEKKSKKERRKQGGKEEGKEENVEEKKEEGNQEWKEVKSKKKEKKEKKEGEPGYWSKRKAKEKERREKKKGNDPLVKEVQEVKEEVKDPVIENKQNEIIKEESKEEN